MAHFKRLNNSYIYIYHWIDGNDSFKISTKMRVEQDNRNEHKQLPKNLKTLCKDRLVISELRRFEETLNKALVLHPELTRDGLPEFRRLFLSILYPTVASKTPEYQLLTYFKDYVDRLKAKKQTNYKYYNTCCNDLEAYLKGKKFTFEDVNMSFYNKFSEYLTKKNLSLNTIATRFKALKAVMQSGFVEELHKNEAFRHFKIKMESTDSVYLSENELEKMYGLSLIGKLDKARDYFIIGAFTGLRFDDWERVSRKRVVDGILSVRSSKTGELSTIPLHPYVSAILDKYEGTLPHKPSNQKMNEYIKIVAARAGVSDFVETQITQGGVRNLSSTEKCELVTTHTARRSLATNLVLRGVSPYIIMKVTGHRTLSSFEVREVARA